MERIHLIVHGVVQGVGFRYHTREAAAQFGLTGMVKNRPDGTVAIVAEGAPSALHQFLAWAKQGPPAAHVTQVDITYGPANGEFSQFTIER